MKRFMLLALLYMSIIGKCMGFMPSLIDHRPDLLSDLITSNLFTNPLEELQHIPFDIERTDQVIMPPSKVDWRETRDTHVITIDVPGMKKEEVKIEVEENRVLRVTGERKREEGEESGEWRMREKLYGKFWRQFKLPDNVDFDKVNAKLEDGVLVISIGKLSPDGVKESKVVTIGGGDESERMSKAETRSEL